MTITTEDTREDLAEAMTNIVATLRRMPSHWTDRRATLHAELDALLDRWQATP